MPAVRTRATNSCDDAYLLMRGTLPETITGEELSKLNSALQLLFVGLRKAKGVADLEDDSGRLRALIATEAVWKFITLFQAALAEELQDPIVCLCDALRALEDGTVTPLVKPPARRGRTRSSPVYQGLQGFAVGTVLQLEETGMPPKKARTKVARTLNSLGVSLTRGKRSITETTLRHWRDTVAEDVTREGVAANTLDQLRARRKRKFATPNQAREAAIAALERFVSRAGLASKKPLKPLI